MVAASEVKPVRREGPVPRAVPVELGCLAELVAQGDPAVLGGEEGTSPSWRLPRIPSWRAWLKSVTRADEVVVEGRAVPGVEVEQEVRRAAMAVSVGPLGRTELTAPGDGTADRGRTDLVRLYSRFRLRMSLALGSPRGFRS